MEKVLAKNVAFHTKPDLMKCIKKVELCTCDSLYSKWYIARS